MNEQDNSGSFMLRCGHTDSAVREAWQKLIQENKDRPRMARIMAYSKLDILEEREVLVLRFFVGLEPHRQWLEKNMLPAFEKRIQEILEYDKIRHEVECNPVKAEANKGVDSLQGPENGRNVATINQF